MPGPTYVGSYSYSWHVDALGGDGSYSFNWEIDYGGNSKRYGFLLKRSWSMKGLIIGVLLLATSCTSILGSDEERRVGVILGMGTSDVKIQIPDAATVGQDLVVVVTTGWPTSCARMGDTEVETRGSNISITPIDIVIENSVCLQAPQMFEHQASIRFSEPGIARVIVRGRASANAPVTEFVKEVSVTTAAP